MSVGLPWHHAMAVGWGRSERCRPIGACLHATARPQILLALQSLLDEPNANSPANEVRYQLFRHNLAEYKGQIRVFARQHKQQ
jgi:hypothetical protein